MQHTGTGVCGGERGGLRETWSAWHLRWWQVQSLVRDETWSLTVLCFEFPMIYALAQGRNTVLLATKVKVLTYCCKQKAGCGCTAMINCHHSAQAPFQSPQNNLHHLPHPCTHAHLPAPAPTPAPQCLWQLPHPPPPPPRPASAPPPFQPGTDGCGSGAERLSLWAGQAVAVFMCLCVCVQLVLSTRVGVWIDSCCLRQDMTGRPACVSKVATHVCLHCVNWWHSCCHPFTRNPPPAHEPTTLFNPQPTRLACPPGCHEAWGGLSQHQRGPLMMRRGTPRRRCRHQARPMPTCHW